WLVLYKTRKKAFCTVCRFATVKKLNSFSKCGDDAFISIGMNNWKDCPGKLGVREKSNYHRECIYKVHASTNQVNVDVQKEIKQATNRSCFLEQFKCIPYLMRVRGHTDDESNFQKLFELVSTNNRLDKEIKQWLKKKCQYTSHDIISEQIKEMYHQAFSKLRQVKQSEIFSVVIDETRDVSEHEQLVFAVRWVGSNYEVAEEFVGLYGCTKMDAIFLLNIIKDVLLQMGLDLKNICGQTYDSASVLQGKAFGEATLLKKENPKALSIHCLNHSLNLVLQEAAKSCLMVRSALEAVHKVHNIIHASAKKLAIFKNTSYQINAG
uniref:DUF4371 domain-containing protein n=1 Tax=Latimeria chalumnae TaxID=7897 RepID=H3AN92_LATCH